MKTRKIVLAAIAAALTLSASAQESQIKWYGFIRNFAHVDTHESLSGTADLFNYVPKDNDNNNATYHFSAITSRLGVDVTGYKYNDMSVSAKIEADFYNGVSGVTGTAVFRLRQAYMTMGWNGNATTLKIGQAWHPMAADMPDVISLNTGAPFGPFSRTPLAQLDRTFDSNWSATAAAIWQQQYTSAGPEGASANYQKYSGIPEIYAGINYKNGGALVRLGVDVLSIKPVQAASDRLTTVSPFFYAQYKKDLFTAKFKTIYAGAGEQVCLNGGYGIAKTDDPNKIKYTPTKNSSSWLSLSYGKDWQGVLFAGYVKNFGTTSELKQIVEKGNAVPFGFWFSKNSYDNMNAMWRLTPTIIRNLGKVALGLEYEITSVQYGDKNKGMDFQKGLYNKGLHWVTNNRIQAMFKFTF